MAAQLFHTDRDKWESLPDQLKDLSQLQADVNLARGIEPEEEM